MDKLIENSCGHLRDQEEPNIIEKEKIGRTHPSQFPNLLQSN